jgi:hypothetical protein
MHVDWKTLVRAIALPIVAAAVPGGAALAPLIAAGITAAEDLKASGSDKKAAGRVIAQAAAEGVNAVRPGTVNPAEVAAAYDATVDAIVHSANIPTKKIDGPVLGVPLVTP